MPTLDWLNRAEALTSSDKVPYRILEPVSEHGTQPPSPTGGGVGEPVINVAPHHDNLLIQGDNLDALKALLPFYRGRVKCIFIDPPYNTKSAFEHYDDNLEHSQWLSMMYPRLVLLRELLSEDGSIWVTIDDNEGHYLKVLMDEVFGRQNFVANVVWRSADSSNNDAKQFSLDHNHIIVYSRQPGWLSIPLARTEASNVHYKNPDNDPRGAWFSGNVSSPKPRENLRFTVLSPSGIEIQPPANGWRWSRESMEEMITVGEIVFTHEGTRLMRKTYLADQGGLSPSTVWDDIEETGHNRQAKYELKKLFPETVTAELFGTPKPERVVMRALQICTNHNDLILDSFLGSGTTAAVAHKMGRRWIGIEMGEHAETHCIPRMKKVLEGEQGGISQAVNWRGGGGFRFLRLGEPMFNADGSIHAAVRFATLASFVWMQETGAPLENHPHPQPLSQRARGEKQAGEGNLLPSPPGRGSEGEGNKTPLLGVHEGRGIYLLFNGILGDKRPQSGNVLTNEVLAAIDSICPHDGPKIIYGEACRLGAARLAAVGVTFKHIPYDVKAR